MIQWIMQMDKDIQWIMDFTCKVLESRRSVCALLPTAYLTKDHWNVVEIVLINLSNPDLVWNSYIWHSSSVLRQTFSSVWGNLLDITLNYGKYITNNFGGLCCYIQPMIPASFWEHSNNEYSRWERQPQSPDQMFSWTKSDQYLFKGKFWFATWALWL